MADTFVWYELMTPDPAKAADWYAKVVGWEIEAIGDYTLLKTAKGGVAGITTPRPEIAATGLPPGWLGYVGVDDVDAAAEAVVKAGGKILTPAHDIPGMLRMAIVADPQSVVYAVFKGYSAGGPPTGGADENGYWGWRELFTADVPKAMDYYAGQYGWTKGDGHDMGPMGVYQLFDVDGVQTGGMMTRPDQMPHSVWNFYAQVDATAACAERIKANGGQIMMGPVQVPGGLWVVQGVDPQGVFCSFISEKP